MRDPVLVPESGRSYERANIEAWLADNMCASSRPQSPPEVRISSSWQEKVAIRVRQRLHRSNNSDPVSRLLSPSASLSASLIQIAARLGSTDCIAPVPMTETAAPERKPP